MAYYIQVPISNAGTEVTNYVELVTINTATPILTGKMNADGSDIRVYKDPYGLSDELDFWILPDTIDTATTRIFVEVGTIPNAGSVNIRIYYGNPLLPSVADGSATFPFFDDFDETGGGGSLNATRWPAQTGTWTEIDGPPTAANCTVGDVGGNVALPRGVRLLWKVKQSAIQTNNTQSTNYWYVDANNFIYTKTWNDAGTRKANIYVDPTTSLAQVSYSWTNGTYYVQMLLISTTNVYFYYDYLVNAALEIHANEATASGNGVMYLAAVGATNLVNYDYVAMCPYDVDITNVPAAEASGDYPGTPVITLLNPDHGAVGATVVITGTGFGAVEGDVEFDGTAASVSAWADTEITCTVPVGAGTGDVVVTDDDGFASAGESFTVHPYISSLTPDEAEVGESVTIAGAEFGAAQGGSTVTFNGTAVTVYSSWSDTSLVVKVPAGATDGNVVVTVGGYASNGKAFDVLPNFELTTIAPDYGMDGDTVVLTGISFGATQEDSEVYFGLQTATIVEWSDTEITCLCPAITEDVNVVVEVGGETTNSKAFTWLVPIEITDVSPESGRTSEVVTITGTGFISSGGTVTFDSIAAPVTSWSDTSITCFAPDGLSVGAVSIEVENQTSESDNIVWLKESELEPPAEMRVDSISPAEGYADTVVTIEGVGFYSSQGSGTVYFAGYLATITSWSDTEIVCTAPQGPASVVTVTVTNAWDMSDAIEWEYLSEHSVQPTTPSISLAFVSGDYVISDGDRGEVYLEINDGTDYALMLNTFAPRPASRIEAYSESSFSDYKNVREGLDRLDNLKIPLSIRIAGIGRDDRDAKVDALLYELRRASTLWLMSTFNDVVKYYECHPPIDILTDVAWQREFQHKNLAIVDCEMLAREPFGPWEELTLDESHYVGMEVTSPPSDPNAVVGIVIPPEDIDTEAPTPVDVYIDFTDIPTNVLLGQRMRYHAEFDPVREFEPGEEVLDSARLNGDYRFVDAESAVEASVWDDDFQDYTGDPGTNDVDFAEWVESRSGDTRILLTAYEEGITWALEGGELEFPAFANLLIGMTSRGELLTNPGFEQWTGTPTTPNIQAWNQVGGVDISASAARSGSWGLSMRVSTTNFIYSDPFAIDDTRDYYFSIFARLTVPAYAQISVGVMCFDAGGAYLGTKTALAATNLSTTYTRYGGQVTSFFANTATISVKYELTNAGLDYVHLDDAQCFRSDYPFDESVTTDLIAVDDSLVHKLSWKARMGYIDRRKVVPSKVTVHCYDVGDSLLDSLVLYSGDLYRSTSWKLYEKVINPDDFPAGTESIKIEIKRIGTVAIGPTTAELIPNHHFDDVLLATGYTLDASFPLDSHEGRYLPTAGLGFGGATSYSEVSFSRLLTDLAGTEITGAVSEDSVDMDEAIEAFNDISLLDPRLASITIPCYAVSSNANKSEIAEKHRLSLDPSFDTDLWHDYYALIPVDRSFVELSAWSGEHLIFDSHTGLVMESVDGTLDTAQIHPARYKRGTPRFVMHPEGVNMTLACITIETYYEPDEHEVDATFEVTLRWRPRYRL